MRILTEEMVPYEQLKEIGISKEAFLNFPMKILDDLMKGQLSPLISCTMKVKEVEYEFLSKLLFTHNEKNHAELKLFPIRKELDKTISLTSKEVEQLEMGKVIRKRVKEENKRVYHYLQLDYETKNIITVATNSLYIPKVINNKQLSKEELEKLEKGEIIEIGKGIEKTAIRINLEDSKRLTCIKGNTDDWKKVINLKRNQENTDIISFWKMSKEQKWEFCQIEKQNITNDQQFKL